MGQRNAEGAVAWREKPGDGSSLDRRGGVSETLLESEARRKMDVAACQIRTWKGVSAHSKDTLYLCSMPGGRRMTTARYCGHCNMRFSRCLCQVVVDDHKTNVPNPCLDDAQRTLPILEHSGSRVAIWQRWLNTEGVRLGLWVEPEQHQSSQDRCQKRLFDEKEPKD